MDTTFAAELAAVQPNNFAFCLAWTARSGNIFFTQRSLIQSQPVVSPKRLLADAKELNRFLYSDLSNAA